MIKKIPIKGISRDPSGQLAADGYCAESLNVQLDMGEVAPAIKPVPVSDASGNQISVKGDILFIHKGNGYENVIYREENALKYTAIIASGGANSGVVYDGLNDDEVVNDVTSVGNTVIISTSVDIYYIVWKDGAYHFLGNQVPIPAIHFRMSLDNPRSEVEASVLPTPANSPRFFDSSGKFKFFLLENYPLFYAINGMATFGADNDSVNRVKVHPDNFGKRATRYKTTNTMQQLLADKIWEVIDEKLNEVANEGKAVMPFFIRYAVRLYDGTCYAQSIPVLLGADLEKYIKVRTGVAGMDLRGASEWTDEESGVVYRAGAHSVSIPFPNIYHPYTTEEAEEFHKVFKTYVAFPEPFAVMADYRNNAGLFDGWEDIVAGVDIFVSDQFSPELRDAIGFKVVDGLYAKNPENEDEFIGIYDVAIDPFYTEDSQEKLMLLHQTTYLAKSYTLDEFKALSGEVLLDDISFSPDYILAQEALKETPQSMHHTKGENLFTYNKRLLLAGAEQVLYGGYPFLHSVRWDEYAAVDDYTFVFYIRGDNANSVVITQNASGGKLITPKSANLVNSLPTVYYERPVAWIAYPDSRCYRAEVYKGRERTLVASFRMSALDQVDVAYAFIGFGKEYDFASCRFSVVENPTSEMPNSLLVSKANNPFVFPATDAVTFTAGKILNLAVATKALSEGQFGQFPLYVFTDEGVFAMSVDAQGNFQASHPVSREVLVSRDALTGIEQGVFFASARGLLLLQGSTVTKVSSIMEGAPGVMLAETEELVREVGETNVPFPTRFFLFIKNCKMTYDYMNSRIVLFSDMSEAQYVYKFDTQSWHRLNAGVGFFIRALNSYPESQVVTERQIREGDELKTVQSVFNLSVPAESENAQALRGVIYTRDLALDAADIYKTVSRLKVRGRFENGHVRWQLQGSNDGINYRNLHSLRGPSWKWYRILIVTMLEPNERISYVELDCDPRFTNKIR